MSEQMIESCTAEVVRTEKKVAPGQTRRRSEIGRCACKAVKGYDLCGLHLGMTKRGYYVVRWKGAQHV